MYSQKSTKQPYKRAIEVTDEQRGMTSYCDICQRLFHGPHTHATPSPAPSHHELRRRRSPENTSPLPLSSLLGNTLMTGGHADVGKTAHEHTTSSTDTMPERNVACRISLPAPSPSPLHPRYEVSNSRYCMEHKAGSHRSRVYVRQRRSGHSARSHVMHDGTSKNTSTISDKTMDDNNKHHYNNRSPIVGVNATDMDSACRGQTDLLGSTSPTAAMHNDAPLCHRRVGDEHADATAGVMLIGTPELSSCCKKPQQVQHQQQQTLSNDASNFYDTHTSPTGAGADAQVGGKVARDTRTDAMQGVHIDGCADRGNDVIGKHFPHTTDAGNISASEASHALRIVLEQLQRSTRGHPSRRAHNGSDASVLATSETAGRRRRSAENRDVPRSHVHSHPHTRSDRRGHRVANSLYALPIRRHSAHRSSIGDCAESSVHVRTHTDQQTQQAELWSGRETNAQRPTARWGGDCPPYVDRCRPSIQQNDDRMQSASPSKRSDSSEARQSHRRDRPQLRPRVYCVGGASEEREKLYQSSSLGLVSSSARPDGATERRRQTRQSLSSAAETRPSDWKGAYDARMHRARKESNESEDEHEDADDADTSDMWDACLAQPASQSLTSAVDGAAKSSPAATAATVARHDETWVSMTQYRQLQLRHRAFEHHVETQLTQLREQLAKTHACSCQTSSLKEQSPHQRQQQQQQQQPIQSESAKPSGPLPFVSPSTCAEFRMCPDNIACDEATRLYYAAMLRDSEAEQRCALNKRLCEMQKKISADVLCTCKRWLQQQQHTRKHKELCDDNGEYDDSDDNDETVHQRVGRVEVLSNNMAEHMGVLALQIQRVLRELQKERAERLNWQQQQQQHSIDTRASPHARRSFTTSSRSNHGTNQSGMGYRSPNATEIRVSVDAKDHEQSCGSCRCCGFSSCGIGSNVDGAIGTAASPLSSSTLSVIAAGSTTLTEQKVQQDIIQPALTHIRRLMAAHQKLIDTVVEQRCVRAESVIQDAQLAWEQNVTELRSKVCSLRRDVRNAFTELCQNLNVACPGM